MKKNNEEFIVKFFDTKEEIEKRLDKQEEIMRVVVVVLVVAFITMLIMLGGLVIDTWRWKTNTYKDMEKMLDTQNQELQANRFDGMDKKISDVQESIKQLSDQVVQLSDKKLLEE